MATSALLDTTIQVDREKFPMRKAEIERHEAEFDSVFSTSIVLLEFKATLIEQMITVFNRLSFHGRFTLARDTLLESRHRQVSLRAHILNNIVNVHGGSAFAIDREKDERLADRAMRQLKS